MNTAIRTLAIALTSLALAIGSVSANAQARHGGHGGHGGHWGGHSWQGQGHWGSAPFWGLGIGIGLGSYYAPWYPGYVVVEPPYGVYRETQPVPVQPAAGLAPEPVFYPRNGQTAGQTELDRQECNRWATTQRNAMADASVFHRATLACMDGRGYTAR
jgi:hypothetical protein